MEASPTPFIFQLVDQERIYFAGQNHALGILEAIEYYDLIRDELKNSEKIYGKEEAKTLHRIVSLP